MGCPPVCGDNPRALASGLSYIQVDKHVITITITCTYNAYISVDLAHHEMFRGKGGIKRLHNFEKVILICYVIC